MRTKIKITFYGNKIIQQTQGSPFAPYYRSRKRSFSGRLYLTVGCRHMGHILGYARVSTGDQDLAGQRQRLTAAGAYRIFDDVVSGKIFERPGLTRLMDYVRTGDTLAVVRLDRLGRSLRELLEVVDTLKKQGIALLSLEEKIDTSSAAGELVFHVFGAIAQFERRLIAERTRDGLNAARGRGSVLGRPLLDPDKVNAALTLISAGMSPTKAARHIGLGRSTLYREVRRKKPAPDGVCRVSQLYALCHRPALL
jgi:DNA invertase Pin-like site-specific DNA recombinase